jgi:hypothetical protein
MLKQVDAESQAIEQTTGLRAEPTLTGCAKVVWQGALPASHRDRTSE